MARITPPLNSKGLFVLRAPFHAVATVAYRVGAIRTFEELISRGIDPVKLVYQPAGLDDAEYQADKIAGAAVVTLLSDSTKPLYVPDTYVESYPNMGVVPHSHVVMVMSLGILPDTYDTTRAVQAVQTAISEYIGVEPTVSIATQPTTDAITQEQYVQNLAARNAAIANRSTDFVDKLQLQAQNEQLKLQNAELIAMIEQLQNL